MKSTCSATGSEIPDNANLDDAWAGHPDTSRRSQGCKGMTRQGGLQMLQNYIYILYSYYIYIYMLFIYQSIMAVMAHECPACERDSVWMEQACQECVSSLPLTVYNR